MIAKPDYKSIFESDNDAGAAKTEQRFFWTVIFLKLETGAERRKNSSNPPKSWIWNTWIFGAN
jgi:hypothetical protein